MGREFKIWCPEVSFFQKADAPEDQQRRIGGVVSTEKLDKQGEVIVQKGLDFTPFLRDGWFNDNHSQKTADVLGYPAENGVKRFQKGELLPNGKVADANCTWAEGYLVGTPEAQRIWNLGRELTKSPSGRRLGFSIEGKVRRREGVGGRIVAKAEVRNIAITNCPVGEGTGLETLVKSLTEAQDHITDDDYWKALSMGAANPGQPPASPATGEGAGQILTPESLEGDEKRLDFDGKDKKKDLSKAQALEVIRERYPDADDAFVERAYGTLCKLKERQLL